MQSHPLEFIVSDPEIRSGRPVLKGTGLTVADIAAHRLMAQQSAEELASYYDISLPEVYAALAYYYLHREEIDQDIRERIQLAKQYKEQGLGRRHDPLLSG
jgi:uncharacterized protein (DUF433 family)